MKRFLTCLLCCVMLLGLCACGGVSEEDSRAIELYGKYADLIDRLENEDYSGAMQQLAILSNKDKPQADKTPIAQLFTGQWYPNSIDTDKEHPAKLVINGDGTVTLDGESYTWLEGNSGETQIYGYLLKEGVHTYYLSLFKNEKDQVAEMELYSLEDEPDDDGRWRTDDWLCDYYNAPVLPYLIRSWTNLDGKDELMPDSFYLNRSYAGVNREDYDWTFTSLEETSASVDIDGQYTATLELRGDKPIMHLTENATGNSAHYYSYSHKYDYAWPEYIYPKAVEYLNECLNDVAGGSNPHFWGYLQEGDSVGYSGNAAWAKVYELFAGLGDYKDSAQYLSRFTVLKDMHTGASIERVDNMGNTSTSKEYEIYQYDSQGRMTQGRSNETFRLYGCYDNYTLNFFYDEAGNMVKVQNGTGNNIRETVALTHDDQGRIVGGAYQSNSATHEYSYSYDAEGRLVKNTVWSGSGRYQYTYTYDAQGKLVKSVCLHGWNSPDYINYRYTTQYTYDDQGYLVKTVRAKEYYRSWDKTYELEEGTITTIIANDAQGRPVSAAIQEEGSSYTTQNVTYRYEDLYFFE